MRKRIIKIIMPYKQLVSCCEKWFWGKGNVRGGGGAALELANEVLIRNFSQ